MSERLADLDLPLPPPATIRPAVVTIPWRGRGVGDIELFWVCRGAAARFSGGFWAFPGGKVDAADGEPGAASARVAAIRELYEEAGVLLVRGAERIRREHLRAVRHELLAGADFRALCRREGWDLDLERLVPTGRWLTPEFSPIRFDATFYAVEIRSGEVAEVLPGELGEGDWIRPLEALARWESGAALLHPPTRHIFACFTAHPPEEAIFMLRRPILLGPDLISKRIEFQRGIRVLPLLSPTLPPARHTNCYVIGTGDLLIVDPGAPDAAEQQRLFTLIDGLVEDGLRPRAVLLTHVHRDHIAAASPVAERYGIPIRAHARAAAKFPIASGDLSDGDLFALAGAMPMRIRVVLSEGHADGHVVLYDEGSRAVIAGDLVSGLSTIVLDPPEGRLGLYLESLAKVRDLPCGVLYPAHGMPLLAGAVELDRLAAHRRARMEKIAAALASGDAEVDTIVEGAYDDTPKALFPLAKRSALASLEELARLGRAERDANGRWRRVPA